MSRGRASRRQVIAAALAGSSMLALPRIVHAAPNTAAPEWGHYAGNLAAHKYAPFDRIDAGNAARLGVAWTWDSPDAAILDANPDLKPGEFQSTPVLAEGLLVTSTAMSQVAALDPATGRTVWTFDPESWRKGPNTTKGFVHRGIAVWGRGRTARVILATGDGRLMALDLRSGKPIARFGEGGVVDLRRVGMVRPAPDDPGIFGITSPPLVARDTVVIGSYIDDRADGRLMPRGDIRAFDARTGKLKWVFHTIPLDGQFGVETWQDGSHRRTGNANVWAPMSADPELGIVYAPVSTPTNNFYGGHRPGDGLFGDSLVAIDLETGKRRWHYQIVHHGVWDYDLPAAPILGDVVIDGRPRRIVMQVTKHAFLFVFDRVTGEPIWPIEERPVPASTLPGERTSPTQPHPTWPLPFDRQGVTPDSIIDFTPELRREAETALAGYVHGSMFTPPSTKPTIILPSFVGGANWNGAAFDPETGRIFIPSVNLPLQITLDEAGEIRMAERGEVEVAGARVIARGPKGLPLVKPPYGRTTCIDMTTGAHRWMTPNGRGLSRFPAFQAYHPADAGSFGRSHVLATKTLLFV
ncbi:MAG: PQQ-binding-like beta-propeller repeat protein, partial [Alphaproteobacteria bacterium]|nr:PQQ-binding-like beta-propeller repeat protein [Alphaproteobacteria bacterium]